MVEHAVVVSGIDVNRDLAKVTVLGVPRQPGIASHILRTVSDAFIEAGAIVQKVGKDGATDLRFTVPRSDCARTLERPRDQALCTLDAREVVGDLGVCWVSVAGHRQAQPCGYGRLDVRHAPRRAASRRK